MTTEYITTRDTTTGKVLETIVSLCLEMGGYRCIKQVDVGNRPSSTGHYIDTVATKNNKSIIFSRGCLQQMLNFKLR